MLERSLRPRAARPAAKLAGGAQVTEGARPDGSSGPLLELPAGAEAVSPPVCVNLRYETAKVWLRRAAGDGSVRVSVSYAGTKSETKPAKVENLHPSRGVWTPEAFEVEPSLAPGDAERAREVRFVFLAHSGHATGYQLYGVYVDPRML